MLPFTQIALPEAASPYLEQLLAGEVCPAHPGTTVGDGRCPMCDLDEALFRAATTLPTRITFDAAFTRLEAATA